MAKTIRYAFGDVLFLFQATCVAAPFFSMQFASYAGDSTLQARPTAKWRSSWAAPNRGIRCAYRHHNIITTAAVHSLSHVSHRADQGQHQCTVRQPRLSSNVSLIATQGRSTQRLWLLFATLITSALACSDIANFLPAVDSSSPASPVGVPAEPASRLPRPALLLAPLGGALRRRSQQPPHRLRAGG